MTKRTTSKSVMTGTMLTVKKAHGITINPIIKPEDREPGYRTGRPTLYKPEYCKAVIEFGREGYSKMQMASALNVATSTLDYWTSKHGEFLEALTRARQYSQAWWESIAQQNLIIPQGGGTFNAVAWAKSISARFPADYANTSKHKDADANRSSIKHGITIEFINPKRSI